MHPFASMFLVAGSVLAAEPTEVTPTSRTQSLERRVEMLEAEILRLHREKEETWLSERRKEEIKGLIHEVLADADTRASLLADGATAGHNGKEFFLGSADGSFLLKFGGQVQMRYVVNNRKDAPAAAVDDWETGFTLRRVKVSLAGHVGDPRFDYYLLLAANRDTTGIDMEEAILGYNFEGGVRVFGGRFKDRFARENIISSSRQLTPDRSTIANIFTANDNLVEGVGVEWPVAPQLLKLALTVTDGLNSGTTGGANTGFINGGNDFQNDASDVAMSARADFKLAGDWKNAEDFNAWSSITDLQLFVGAAVHYEVGETGDLQAAATTAATGPYDRFVQWTIDTLIKGQGVAVYAAVFGWHFEHTASNPFVNSDLYAAMIQAGVMVIPDRLEPFVRYEWISMDDLNTNDLNIITAGFNYYFRGHAAKFTADVQVVLDNVNTVSTLGVGLTGVGILTDAAGQDGQVVGRVQFQLLF